MRCVMLVWPRRPVVELRMSDASANASSASWLLDRPGRRVFFCFFFCAWLFLAEARLVFWFEVEPERRVKNSGPGAMVCCACCGWDGGENEAEDG